MRDDEMIERVARALYEHWAALYSQFWQQKKPDWSKSRPGEIWIRQARVAVEAMREPDRVALPSIPKCE